MRPELPDDSESAEMAGLLSDGWTPIAPPTERRQAMRGQLLARTARSVQEHAGLLTVRGKDGAWTTLKPGIRVKALWNGPQGNSVLIELAPGTALPAHRHNWLEEGVVLEGGFQMGELELGPCDYQVSPPGSRHQPLRSRQGVLAFLRGTSLGHKPSVLREILGGWLPMRGAAPQTVFAEASEGWVAVADGVTEKELWRDGDTLSRFYRLAPGAGVPAHVHTQDEECLTLEGEVFLGDILLRAGEYQLAPAGSRHGEIYTDVGALLFVRGAA